MSKRPPANAPQAPRPSAAEDQTQAQASTDEPAVNQGESQGLAPALASGAGKPFLTITATADTWLKKLAAPADELPAGQKLAAASGQRFGVVAVTELPHTAHVEVELAAGAGTWIIWQPHWSGFSELPKATPSGSIDWNDFGVAVGCYLTVGEVLQFDRRRRPPADSADIGRLLNTARQFDAVRRAWGGPLGVTSFYRPEPINSQVGGARSSQHVAGCAMDIYPIGRSLQEFFAWIYPRWTGGLGDGRSRSFIHLDTRGGGGFAPGAGRRPAAVWDY
jgi:putative chitinase